MKFLTTYRATVPTTLVREHDEAPAVARAVPTRQPRLPRDAHVAFSTNPTELYLSMTIRKLEHIEALMETLQTFAQQVEYGRRREEDDRKRICTIARARHHGAFATAGTTAAPAHQAP